MSVSRRENTKSVEISGIIAELWKQVEYRANFTCVCGVMSLKVMIINNVIIIIILSDTFLCFMSCIQVKIVPLLDALQLLNFCKDFELFGNKISFLNHIL